MKKTKLNFTFKVIKDSQVIQRCQTYKKRKFLRELGTIDWKNKPLKVHLRVHYGRGKNAEGKMVSFYNDGEYKTKWELMIAFRAFTEKSLIKEFIDDAM